MEREHIEARVKSIILDLAYQQGYSVETVQDDNSVVDDLGFSSLDVATLTAMFETEFGVNPFRENLAALTEIRTVRDVCDLYDQSINGTAKGVSQASTPSDERMARRLRKG